jgi:hypothetical protein
MKYIVNVTMKQLSPGEFRLMSIHDCLADAQAQVGKAFAEYAVNPSQASEAKFKEKYRALSQVALSANQKETHAARLDN